MELFRKILVGVDLSHSEQPTVADLNLPTRSAVERATWLAGQIGAELTFFSAIDLAPPTQDFLNQATADGVQTIEDKANAVLVELAAQAQSQGITAQAQCRYGSAWEEIIRQVEQGQHDLVVVGTRDAGFASRLLFGSTGLKLLRACPCPVWVTKPGADWEDLEILVASDFSAVSQVALELGVRAARLTGARLRVLHVLEHTVDRRMRHTGLAEDKLKAYREEAKRDAEQKLQEQLQQTDYRTLAAGVIADVQEGPADMVILEVIEQHKIDLLIMGTIARRGITGLLVGNTAEKLLSQLPCGLLAIKPLDRKHQ